VPARIVATTPPADPVTGSPALAVPDELGAATLELVVPVAEELGAVPAGWLALVAWPPPELPQPAPAHMATAIAVGKQMRWRTYIAHRHPRLGRGHVARAKPTPIRHRAARGASAARRRERGCRLSRRRRLQRRPRERATAA
jgi:hypothetical protein